MKNGLKNVMCEEGLEFSMIYSMPIFSVPFKLSEYTIKGTLKLCDNIS